MDDVELMMKPISGSCVPAAADNKVEEGRFKTMPNLKIGNATWSFIILLFLSIMLVTACQRQSVAKSPAENVTENISQAQQPGASTENISLESGFEIPGGIFPFGPNADNLSMAPAIGPAYTHNVKDTTIVLGNGTAAYSVEYRDYIEANAGQVRYDLIVVRRAGAQEHIGIDKEGFDVVLRAASKLDKIILFNAISGYYSDWGINKTVLEINISPSISPGDNTFQLLVFVNGIYYGRIPFTIRVIE